MFVYGTQVVIGGLRVNCLLLWQLSDSEVIMHAIYFISDNFTFYPYVIHKQHSVLVMIKFYLKLNQLPCLHICLYFASRSIKMFLVTKCTASFSCQFITCIRKLKCFDVIISCIFNRLIFWNGFHNKKKIRCPDGYSCFVFIIS